MEVQSVVEEELEDNEQLEVQFAPGLLDAKTASLQKAACAMLRMFEARAEFITLIVGSFLQYFFEIVQKNFKVEALWLAFGKFLQL
jgi:hypothetical protein